MKVAKCEHCGAKFDVSKLASGVKIRCGRCKEIFTVPDLADSLTAPKAKPSAKAAAAADAPEKPAARPDRGTAVRARPDRGTSVVRNRPATEEDPPRKDTSVRNRPAAQGEGKGTSVRNRPAEPGESKGTSVRNRPAEPGESKGTSVRNRGTSRTGEEDSPSKAGRRSASGARAVADKKKNQMVLLASGGGLVLLLTIVFFVFSGRSPAGAGKSGSGDSASSPYERAKAKFDMNDPAAVAKFAIWCATNGLPDQRDEHLLEAYKLDAKNETVQAAISQVYHGRLAALPPDDAKGHWELVLFLDRFAMQKEGNQLADHILKKINKNHPETNQRFGRVLYEGKWEDKDMAEMAMARRDESSHIAGMTPRQREVYNTVESTKKNKGALGFEYLDMGSDDMPYLIFVQKSKQYAAESALSEFSEVLGHLYKLFYAQYSHKFDLTDLKEEVMVVWVYDSRETYMRESQAPPIARGHYNPADQQVQTFNESSQRYEVIFHEGVHQLIDRITTKKGGKSGNMFWFTEGIATYFETFKRDQNLDFVLGAVASGSWLPNIKAAIRSTPPLFVPLERFVSLVYAQAFTEFPPQLIGGLLYPEAWSLVHFFYNYDNGKYRSKFEDYFKAECMGLGGKEKFAEIFGDVKAIQTEWIGYVSALK